MVKTPGKTGFDIEKRRIDQLLDWMGAALGLDHKTLLLDIGYILEFSPPDALDRLSEFWMAYPNHIS